MFCLVLKLETSSDFTILTQNSIYPENFLRILFDTTLATKVYIKHFKHNIKCQYSIYNLIFTQLNISYL